jgi:hypothetical protein
MPARADSHCGNVPRHQAERLLVSSRRSVIIEMSPSELEGLDRDNRTAPLARGRPLRWGRPVRVLAVYRKGAF